MGLTERLFNLRKEYLEDIVPLSKHSNFYDSSTKPQYGKVDFLGNVVYPSERRLTTLPTSNKNAPTIYALNFVAHAFSDFRDYYRKAVTVGGISNSQEALSIIEPVKGWESVHTRYANYIDQLYSLLINEYFESTGVSGDQIDRRPANFDEFMKLMDTLMLQKGKSVYLNRSSFILSRGNDISSTGLVVEITPQITLDATFQNSDQINRENFYSNPNFDFYMESLKKFGFMADINYPGRIVADIGSPAMQEYMSMYGVQFNDVFEQYFYNANESDYYIVKTYLSQFYNSYATQYPTKHVVVPGKCGPVQQTVTRQTITQQELDEKYNDDFWLTTYANMLYYELGMPINKHQLEKIIKNAKSARKNIDIDTAIRYITETMREYKYPIDDLMMINHVGIEEDSVTSDTTTTTTTSTSGGSTGATTTATSTSTYGGGSGGGGGGGY